MSAVTHCVGCAHHAQDWRLCTHPESESQGFWSDPKDYSCFTKVPATIQTALSELLGALGFDAMARDVKGERDPKRLAHYARIVIKQSPVDKKQQLASHFYSLKVI